MLRSQRQTFPNLRHASSVDAIGKSRGSMRFCAVILLVGGTLALPVRGLVKAAEEIFSLTISTPREAVKSGSDSQLLVKLTNDTNHEITLFSRNTYCDYTLEVRDSNGQSAPETEQKRKLDCTANPVAGRLVIIKLKPGEHHEDLIFVNYLFDMSHPDKYTVQVAREIPKELGQGQVKSNTIGITVTE
jgi:hypothetical protein